MHKTEEDAIHYPRVSVRLCDVSFTNKILTWNEKGIPKVFITCHGYQRGPTALASATHKSTSRILYELTSPLFKLITFHHNLKLKLKHEKKGCMTIGDPCHVTLSINNLIFLTFQPLTRVPICPDLALKCYFVHF